MTDRRGDQIAGIGTAGIALLLLAGVAGADPAASRRDALLYMLKQDCGSCHGLTLRGGLGPPLRPEALVGKPRQMLQWTILEGRPGTAMPPWRPLMSEAEAGWLADRLLAGDVLR